MYTFDFAENLKLKEQDNYWAHVQQIMKNSFKSKYFEIVFINNVYLWDQSQQLQYDYIIFLFIAY